MSSGAWTAVGTIFLALVTLAAVVTTIVITGQDRRAADSRQEAERALSDQRLREQREHSDKQLADERAFSRAQIEEERRVVRDREQLSEAYSVQVVARRLSTEAVGEEAVPLEIYVAAVINHGHYTITGIEAQILLTSGGSPSLIPFTRREGVSSAEELTPVLGDRSAPRVRGSFTDRLTPWDLAVRFESDPIAAAKLVGAEPVVRWVDQWGTHWERRLGEARHIPDGEPWAP